ncbi:MAG: Asp-tRNA(Asn)/Glu-tRNA(Gln) amidotransferase subunit GatA [Planctomycetota bacterium]
MSVEVAFATVAGLRGALRAGETSAEALTQATLARIAELNPHFGAFREVIGDQALARARGLDAAGLSGPLAGVPVAIKDCMCHVDGTTACSSKMLEAYRSPFTATAVERLEAAGAVVVGKTAMDEFAMGSSCENCAFGVTRNPWDRTRVPGGSSGGSACAVGAGMVSAALGSDTGGSIRQPAALCGTVGFKPTYGRISRWGLVAFASSLDQIGPFTRTVEDAALLSSVMFGKDPLDSTSADVAVDDDLTQVERDPGVVRIGLPKQYRLAGANDPAVDAAVERAQQAFEAAGAELVEVDLPHTEYGIATYYVVATAEASSNLARFDGVHYGHRTPGVDDLVELYSKSRSEGFGEEVQRRIMLGTYVLSAGYYDAYYNRALKVRRLIRGDFDTAFEAVDAILCPTTTGPAFEIGAKTDDPLAMYLNDVYTVPASLAGLPAVSLPGGFAEVDGKPLPVGVQLIGRAFDEARLLRLARVLERSAEHHKTRPDLTAATLAG